MHAIQAAGGRFGGLASPSKNQPWWMVADIDAERSPPKLNGQQHMQVLLNGISTGLVLALLAVGFQVVYLPTRVFFLGLAAIYAAAPYIARASLVGGWPWWLAIAAAVSAAVALSMACELVNHAPLAKKQASPNVHLVASLGVYVVLVQLLAMLWGSDVKTIHIESGLASQYGGLFITHAQWIALGVTTSLLLGFAALLMQSGFGTRLRAMADNPVQFALLGYNSEVHRLAAFALAGVLAAASSLVTAYDVGFEPHGGLHVLLLAVVSVIVGGRGSFLGPVVGAVLLGLLREHVTWWFSARWQEAFTFALLAACLLLRPHGLLGRKMRLEASVS